MIVPRVDRLSVTPQSLLGQWPRIEGGALESVGLFDKHQPEGAIDLMEKLAVSILSHSAEVGQWKPFTANDARAFVGSNWLPRFVRAGFLFEAGGTYLITDLFILWLIDHLRRVESEWNLSQSVRNSVLGVLCAYSLDASHCINFLNEGKLYILRLVRGGAV